jgi:branched-chain amino acid transport system permease protein
MALFVTFSGWSMIEAGYPYWAMFALVLVIAGALGAFIERTVIRPVEGAPVLNVVIVTLGLFVIFNSLTAFIWAQGELPKSFPATPFTELKLDRHLSPSRSTGAVIIISGSSPPASICSSTAKSALPCAAPRRTGGRAFDGHQHGRMLMLGWALSSWSEGGRHVVAPSSS